MRTVMFSFLMAAAVSAVIGGSLFNEKEEAVNTVTKKYQEAQDYATKIQTDINNEKEKKDENSEKSAKQILAKKFQEAAEELKKNTNDFIRTAIAKGKPVLAIECIGKTLVDGEKLISDINKDSDEKIKTVLKDKLKKLEFLKIQVDLIFQGLKELEEQALKKINDSKSGYEALKAEALKKVDSASKQLHDIEIQITKPLLSDEYMASRKQFENKFKEISDILFKRLQKCVA